jgi:hypothetical protein
VILPVKGTAAWWVVVDPDWPVVVVDRGCELVVEGSKYLGVAAPACALKFKVAAATTQIALARRTRVRTRLGQTTADRERCLDGTNRASSIVMRDHNRRGYMPGWRV